MLYFFVRVVVNTLAAALVMNVVPGLQVLPYYANPLAGILLYSLIGLAFEILHTFLRPVILFLSGRLYVWSMGLVALLADTFIFLLISYMGPTRWEIGSMRLFSAVIGAMLLGFVVISLNAITGLDSPHLTESSQSPFYWRWLGMLPTGKRNRLVESLRTQQMVSTIRRYGVDILVGVSPFGNLRRAFQRLLFRRTVVLIDQTPIVKIRIMLQELGPTFVKFGQMLASRSEILPNEWRIELERLQDDAKPFSFNAVREIIQKELGKPLEEAFASFEPRPLAAASTAQVHAATLPGGDSVVVKIRRPDIEVTVKGDLNVMQDVINLVEKRIRWSRQFGMSALFQEFAENVLTELDFTNEAYNARLLGHNMQQFPFVDVPHIYGEFSAKRILTQERVNGVKIVDIQALDERGINHEQIAINFFRALLQQVLFDGFFHADPHPGNVWVSLENQHIVFLDMGLMGYLTLENRLSLGELIWALQDRDTQSISRVLIAICKPSRSYDQAAIQRDVERLVNRNLLFVDAAPSLTEMMTELLLMLLNHGLQLRKEFTLAIKAMGQGEAIMRALLGDQPTSYILDVSYTQLKELLLKQITLENVINHTAKPFAREIFGRFPALQTATTSWLDNFQKGQLAFQLNTDDIDQKLTILRASIEMGIRRIVASVLLVGLLLGSTLALFNPFEAQMSEVEGQLVRRTAEIGFAISTLLIVILLIYTLWQTLRKTKSS